MPLERKKGRTPVTEVSNIQIIRWLGFYILFPSTQIIRWLGFYILFPSTLLTHDIAFSVPLHFWALYLRTLDCFLNSDQDYLPPRWLLLLLSRQKTLSVHVRAHVTIVCY